MGEGRKMLERLWNPNSLGNPFSGYSTLRKKHDIIQKHAAGFLEVLLQCVQTNIFRWVHRFFFGANLLVYPGSGGFCYR